MAYRFEKNRNQEYDLVIDGWDKGIGPSPYKGIGNIQSANISTELGEVMSSFGRIRQLSSTAITGTLTPLNSSTVSPSVTIPVGSWITITSDSGTGLTGNYYYVNTGKLSRTFAQDNTTEISNIILNGSQQIIYLTSGTTWTVPSDWNSSTNTIEVIGAGGGAGGGNGSGIAGTGAGAGAYSKISNLALTPGASITYAVGVGGTGGTAMTGISGGDTYFNGASIGASSVGAKGGAGGPSLATGSGGAGGLSSAGIGTTKYSGGNGGATNVSTAPGIGAGGGGSAGPNGAGANGGNAVGTGGVGGQGDNGFGGTGGLGGSAGVSPTAGANGTEFDASHGSGGGGGGSANRSNPGSGGANGGSYGAGGGGASDLPGGSGGFPGGNGFQGLIRITYYPTTPITTFATFSVVTMDSPIQSATETYRDSSNVTQYRYYILDASANVWIHDTTTFSGVPTPTWFLSEVFGTPAGRPVSGLAVLNGWLTIMVGSIMYWKSTSTLGVVFAGNSVSVTRNFHATLVGHQGKMYYTDGNFIGSIFPSSSLVTGAANIQSYVSYTAVTTTGTLSATIGGSIPQVNSSNSPRLPVSFFTAGTLPAAITANTTYYIETSVFTNSITFQVFSAASGGSALDIQTGSSGTQYFNTFNPFVGTTYTYTPQRLNLPFFEVAQCLAELGNLVVIGGQTNTLYPWNQVDALPSDIIPLPENNVVNMVTANNMLYVFAGQKGNIYICNGSSASPALSIPDFCAGIAGTKNSYIEPYFSWGGAMFMRGRIWFSVLDQTASKIGNCGGIWSFIPTNNLFIGQDTGLALRLENQSTYGTYNGVSPVLIASLNQLGIAPQYWSAWYSSITSPTFGIDFTDTIPTVQTIIETDLIPTGTMLQNRTFQQIEYKLSVPLVAGDSITINYRQNITDSYQSCGTVKTQSSTELSGYFTANFQNGQWLQLQIILNPVTNSTSSFCRLTEVRAR